MCQSVEYPSDFTVLPNDLQLEELHGAALVERRQLLLGRERQRGRGRLLVEAGQLALLPPLHLVQQLCMTKGIVNDVDFSRGLIETILFSFKSWGGSRGNRDQSTSTG